MENKTALEQLIERIDSAIVLNKESDHPLAIERGMIYNLIRDHAKQLLEEEKMQIINAYWAGLNGSINDYSESKTVGSELVNIKAGEGADNYYKETYGK